MQENNYKPLYLLLFNRITDVTRLLKDAQGDAHEREWVILRAIAELSSVQVDAEELLLSQEEPQ